MTKAVILCLLVFLVYFANIVFSYATYALQEYHNTSNGFEGWATLKSGSGPYGNDIKNLKIQTFYETENAVRVKISDKDNARWEVPYVVTRNSPAVSPKNRNYEVYVYNEPFGFIVKRISDNAVIFNSTHANFAFSDQYIEISNQLPRSVVAQGHNLYGLGENIHKFKLENRAYTLWNRDHFAAETNVNLYGTHPFYLELRDGGVTHGVFLLNTNAMDVIVSADKIQYKTIGGILDFWFFMGGKPEDTIKQYHELIGKPYMPPFWSLGFMQCRWGYKSIQETANVVANYKKYQIPLDVMFNDIDYMDAYKDFTVDPKNYPLPQVQQFIKQLHADGQRYVVIIDPGIKVENGYEPYTAGLEQQVYINTPDGKPLVNKVWPGLTVFPDFSNVKAHDYWYYFINKFMKDVPVDGLWIDMNEVAAFCDGECEAEKKKPRIGFNPRNPPYVPVYADNLEQHTIRMDAVMNVSIYYNAHDLYGFLESIATTEALKKVTNKRPFVLTRSTYAGSGRYCAHWLGDNDSSYQSMYESLPGILNMNMFGINHVGADICGFGGDTTEELCTRWMQLGSFYPFSRNHNAIDKRPQEPYVFGEKLANISRNVLLNRYSILPYYYTLFFQNNVEGGTLVKPLFFEFPTDKNTFGIDKQILIGPALMVSPVLTQGQTSVLAYFAPDAIWYDYYTGAKVSVSGWTSLPAPIDVINAHVRGGYIIPKQTPALTTTETRKLPMQLLVALDKSGAATGSLYLDDGESLNSIEDGLFTSTQFTVQTANNKSTLSSTITKNKYYSGLKFDHISVYGANRVCSVQSEGKQLTFNYDNTNRVLEIFTSLPVNVAMNIVWTYC